MSHHIGRQVKFRNRQGIQVVGTVTKVNSRFGSMELDVDGEQALIGFPFRGDAVFVDNGQRF